MRNKKQKKRRSGEKKERSRSKERTRVKAYKKECNKEKKVPSQIKSISKEDLIEIRKLQIEKESGTIGIKGAFSNDKNKDS